MRPFGIERAGGAPSGLAEGATFCAGGTTLVDLLKLDVLRPDRVVDLLPLRGALGGIALSGQGLVVGALATMAEAAAHPHVEATLPVVAEAILKAASPQIRNAATIGGNLLQRTRCGYFRDSASPCNKREPGAGCSALGGDTRGLAVLGTSAHCIANYPGDLAVALAALDAEVATVRASGDERRIPVEHLHRLPGDRPDLETVLEPGELIASVVIPSGDWDASAYVKVRDRASYAFALASAAVALRLDGDGAVAEARIALGGLAAKPWRCRAAEEALRGLPLDEAAAWRAARLCLAGAEADVLRLFKVDLGRRVVVKALLDVVAKARSRHAKPAGAAGEGRP